MKALRSQTAVNAEAHRCASSINAAPWYSTATFPSPSTAPTRWRGVRAWFLLSDIATLPQRSWNGRFDEAGILQRWRGVCVWLRFRLAAAGLAGGGFGDGPPARHGQTTPWPRPGE
jgi:hypothetical protein